MEPNLEELPLVMQNTKPEEDDCCDPVVDGWMKLLKRGKNICFEEVFKKDVEGRAKKDSEEKKEKMKGKGKAKKKESLGSSDDLKGLKESMEAGFKYLGEMICDTNNNLGARLTVLEAFAEAQKKGKAHKEAEEEEKEAADDESEAADESEAEVEEKEAAEDESEAEDEEKEGEEDEKEAEEEGSEAEKDERKAQDADVAGVHRKRPLSAYTKPITRGAKKGRKK